VLVECLPSIDQDFYHWIATNLAIWLANFPLSMRVQRSENTAHVNVSCNVFFSSRSEKTFSLMMILWGVLKTKTPKTPKTRKTSKTPKFENKDPPYFLGLRNYDQPVANATESWALATRISRLLLASLTGIRGNWFVLNRKKCVLFQAWNLPLVSSKFFTSTEII